MVRTRRAAQVLALAIVAWLVAAVAGVAWLLSMYLPDPSSHQAEDATLGLALFTPVVIVALIGLPALVVLWRNDGLRTIRLLQLWGFLAVIVGLLGSWRFLGLVATLVTEGRRLSWSASESSLVFATATGADSTHWEDWSAFALLVVALVGLVAVEVLALTPGSRPPSSGRRAHT